MSSPTFCLVKYAISLLLRVVVKNPSFDFEDVLPQIFYLTFHENLTLPDGDKSSLPGRT